MSKVTSLEGKIPRQPLREVTSVERSDLFVTRSFERWNPDQLASRKGGLALYSRMMMDEQVKAVVDFKRASIIGRGYTFEFCESELPKEEQLLRKQVMEQMVKRMRGSFSDSLRAVLLGIVNGYSLTEFVTDRITVGGKTYVGIHSLLSRKVEDFAFHTDAYGELLRFVQRVNGNERDLDLARFIHYVQTPEEDAYYGGSELKAAYRAWFLKDTTLKFWMQYLERMAGGFLAIQLGSSGITANSPDYAILQDVLKNLRGTMGVILPGGVEAEMLTPTSTDAYQQAVEFHDLSIAKALLIPNLLGLSNSGETGAYAQSQTQLETYFMTVAADSQRLEQALNDQLFKPIAKQNWDDGEFPQFTFKNASAEHTKWIVETWSGLIGSNAVITTEKDEAHLRKLLTMPDREEDDEALVTPQQAAEAANSSLDRAGADKEREHTHAGADKDREHSHAMDKERLELEKKEADKPKTYTLEEARILFHTPGGHDHDQMSHGRGGGGAVDKAVREETARQDQIKSEAKAKERAEKAKKVARAKPGSLTPEQQEIEQRFAEKVANDYEDLKAEYATFDDAKGGKVLNVDTMREASEDYIADRSQSAAVHEPASAAIKQMYAEKLAEEPKPGEQAQVLFTAGGTGAGKSTALTKTMPMAVAQSQIVYDTNMAGFESSRSKIDQALKEGAHIDRIGNPKDVVVAMTWRDPIDALENGALPRATSQEKKYATGRTVPLETHLNTHYESNETFHSLREHYKDNPRVVFVAVNNSLGHNKSEPIDAANVPRLDRSTYDANYTKSVAIIERQYKEGKISERTRNGFLEGKATKEKRSGTPSARKDHSAGAGGQPEQERTRKLRFAVNAAARRVDFAVVAMRSATIELTASEDVARHTARAVRRLIDAERLPQLLDEDTKDIGELRLDNTDVGKIKATFRGMLERAWGVGLYQAMDESGKIRKRSYTKDERKLHFADLRDNAAAYFESNAFRMAGNLTDAMRAIIQQELLNGVKSGTRPEEVAAKIYSRLIRKGMTTLEAMQMEESRSEIKAMTTELLADALEVVNVPAYINTLARTNTFEAMNEARYAEFTDPAVADFVEALQYSAILDDRTTDICAEMDGHIHAADSAVWDTHRPPLHFNCRSLLIAVTKLDGWDGVEDGPPTVQPADGFA